MMSRRKFHELLTQTGRTLVTDAFVNACITYTLKSDDPRELDVGEIVDATGLAWDDLRMPCAARFQASGIAAQYPFLDYDMAVILERTPNAGAISVVPQGFKILFSARAFKNPVVVGHMVRNHNLFYDCSQDVLAQTFDENESRKELRNRLDYYDELYRGGGFAEKLEYMARRAVEYLRVHASFGKSPHKMAEMVSQDCRARIRTCDALVRFFGAENDFVSDYLRTAADKSEVGAGIGEIGERAENIGQCYRRLRHENVRSMTVLLRHLCYGV